MATSLANQADTHAVTSKSVARLGCGAMRPTGRSLCGERRDRDECIRVLRRAVERGVGLVDTQIVRPVRERRDHP